MKNKLIILFLFLTNILFSANGSATYYRLKVGIHFDSNVSGGKYSLEELASHIARTDLDAAILTDHDNMKVSWGFEPFDKFVKYSIEESSVSKYGYKNYFSIINQLDKIYQRVILIPGIEAVPFYHWQGSPMLKTLTLRDWHRHLLVFGMDDINDYKNLPSIPNGIGYKKTDLKNIVSYITENYIHFLILLVYFIIFIVAFLSIFRRRRIYNPLIEHRKRKKKVKFSIIAFIVAIIFGLILKSEYPFLPTEYDQYHGDPGPGPYQNLIDYVNNNNGLVFYAHPEVRHHELRPVDIPYLKQTISITTEAYPFLITQTKNHSGYAIFWEGMKVVGKPGGLWDMALKEYCLGMRGKPIWAIGELDFEESNDLKQITETNTFVFTKEKSKSGIFEAMKAGRMYATRNYIGNVLTLEDFSVNDLMSRESAFIGETLKLTSSSPSIHIKMRLKPGNTSQSVLLFRNDQLIERFRLRDVLDVWYEDRSYVSDNMYYYRIMVGETWQTLATNPIFVNKN